MKPYTLLFLLPALFCLASAHPDPADNEGAANEEEKGRYIYSTDKCDESEFQSMKDSFSSCADTANEVISRSFFEGGFDDKNIYRKAVCEGWSGVLDCLDEFGPLCFNDEEMEQREQKFLVDYFRTAYNDTDLGRNFVSSCPTLNTRRDELMQELTGSTKCTYIEYDQRTDLFTACIKQTVNERSRKVDKLEIISSFQTRVALFSKIECEANTLIMNECVPLVQTCLGQKENDEFVKTWEGNIDDRNRELQADIPTFDYESCGGFDVIGELEAKRR